MCVCVYDKHEYQINYIPHAQRYRMTLGRAPADPQPVTRPQPDSDLPLTCFNTVMLTPGGDASYQSELEHPARPCQPLPAPASRTRYHHLLLLPPRASSLRLLPSWSRRETNPVPWTPRGTVQAPRRRIPAARPTVRRGERCSTSLRQ